MKRLRVVDPANPDVDVSMAEALEGLVKECIADSPVAVMLVWERQGGKMTTKAVPDSIIIKRGFIDALYELMFGCDDKVVDEPPSG